jgi:hypothetical protein
VAGDDEARARATLVEMQGRIAQGPLVALGLLHGASPEQVRGAFLALTKIFHPARFGRMATEIQKLSTEVFLGIKSAHDALLKTLGAAPRGAVGPPTGPFPALPRAASPLPHAPPNTTQKFQPPPPRSNTPALGVRLSSPRPGTPPLASAGDPQTQRGVGVPAKPNQPNPDERLELQRALELIAVAQWSNARTAMTALAARVPSSKQYRALLCYTRGREAQAVGKGEEAVMELQRALQLDPELAMAKTALAELLRRR